MEFLDRDKSYVWSAERTQKLIGIYETYPCLYNTKSNGYKDKALRIEVWQHIADQMGTTHGEIVKKIRGLRTQFAREKAKRTARSRWGDNAPYSNAWTYFESLSFLDDFVTPRNKSNIDWNLDYNQETVEMIDDEEVDDSSEPASQVYEVREQVKQEPEEADDCLIVSPTTQTNVTSSQSGIRQHNPYSTLHAKNIANKRKRSNPSIVATQSQLSTPFQLPNVSRDTQQPATSNRSPVQTLQVTSYTTARESQSPPVSSTNETQDGRSNSGEDDEIFAKYITSELRQIKDPHVKRIVKHKIQNIIFEAHCSLHK